LQESGLNPVQAVLRAAEIRLRPILMTSLAFVFGILPLVFASGAGAGARHSLGTAVCGGMVVSTVLSVFVVPVIYVTIASLRPRQARPPEELQPYENGDGAPDQLPFVGSDNAASKRQ
jgi:Cu/Ag efflux pump CusA